MSFAPAVFRARYDYQLDPGVGAAMNDEIEQIRAILASLKLKIGVSPDEAALRDLAALELPEILSDVVDYLMPQLTPYQAAFYFYLFRHSILSSGTQHVRVSVRCMKGIATSPRTDSDAGYTCFTRWRQWV